MKYYALFLNTGGYIEKCLALIRYICNPSSKNYPHITIRVYKDDHLGIEDIIQKPIFYVNMIEAGSFNMDSQIGPYTVFLRFESEELEEIDYKPDYPFSFMHLTLYDGDNYLFATELLKALNGISWNVKLSFNEPLFLTKNSVGRKNTSKDYKDIISEYWKDILGYQISSDIEEWDDHFKLLKIKEILAQLDTYYKQEKIEIPEQNYDASAILDAYSKSMFFATETVKETAKATAFVTPPEYAKEMAMIAFDYYVASDNQILFGDSAVGTGALYLAVFRYLKDHMLGYEITSAIGIDINQKMALEAKRRYYSRGLQVIWGDCLIPEIDSYLQKKRNLMLVNPPYSRSADISDAYKKAIQKYAFEQTGITVSGRAGLYVYHILIMDKWLADKGIAVWLIPSTFIQTEYGRALRLYLIKNVKLLQMHFYPEERHQFEKAMVSTCLLVFKKDNCSEEDRVRISFGDSAESTKYKTISIGELSENLENWRSLLFGKNKEKTRLELQDTNHTVFSDLFDIKRGIATGANDFFVMKEEEATEKGIPDSLLKPVLPKARYLNSQIIEGDENGKPLNISSKVLLDINIDEETIKNQYPELFDYLQTAKIKKDGKAIIDRTLIKNRNPWYKQESREAPLYLLTYMGRDKQKQPPLYFILNKSNAVALNTYICLYPKEWLKKILENDDSLQEELLECLNYSARSVIPAETRTYSGALQKMEPGILKKLPIVKLPDSITKELKNQ